MNIFGRTFRALHNVIAQATGFGNTRNIIDCYAALIRLWSPGDRIFSIESPKSENDPLVCTENLSSAIVVVKSTKDGM
jgi:hypothetical protein